MLLISITVKLHVYIRDCGCTVSQWMILALTACAIQVHTKAVLLHADTLMNMNVQPATGNSSGPTEHVGMVRQVECLSVPPSVYTTSLGFVPSITALYLFFLSVLLCYHHLVLVILLLCARWYPIATKLDSANKHTNQRAPGHFNLPVIGHF